VPGEQSSSDPIFAAIREHRAAARGHDKAVDAENDESNSRTDAELGAATSEAFVRLNDTSTELVSTLPTTLAGLVAVCRYMAPVLEVEGTPRIPLEVKLGNFETAFGAFCRTVADAIEGMHKGPVTA
jgi:hypothetical protein